MTDPPLIAQIFSNYRRLEKNLGKYRKAVSRRKDLPPEAAIELDIQEASTQQLKKHIDPLRLGTPCGYRPEIVMRVNSLQMLYAGRWIVSSKQEFSLPLKMIAENPEFRERRRFEVL